MDAHTLSELKTLACHREISSRLLRDPVFVLKKAQENLQRWQSNSFHGELPAALSEWKNILDTRTNNEIAQLLKDEREEGFRLRSSSPFAGVLSQSERRNIRKKTAHQYNET